MRDGPIADAGDQELVERLPTEWAAYEEFYRRHVGRVVGFAVRRLGDPEQVADLVAAVFLEVMTAARRYDRGKGEPPPWLLGIAARVLANQRRRDASERRALGRIQGQRLLAADDYARLEERIDAANLGPRLDAAMRGLSEPERVLLELVGVEQLSPSQAAAVLGIRPATARMRLSRARRKARLALDLPGAATAAIETPGGMG